MSSRFAKPGRSKGGGQGAGPDALAEMLHRGAIGLLRRVKAADQETGVSPPRLSALSVLVFAGPQSLASLARAEGVKPPTMSKLVVELEASGLVEKSPDPKDGRGLVIAATSKGRKIMLQGRDRRLTLLKQRLAKLSRTDISRLEAAAPLLLDLARADRAIDTRGDDD
jgi:DNA-binding MarR family transcriptional regulator